MFREEFLEFRQTHHGDLFAMVGMRSRPDINEGCPGFVDLGENLVKGGGPIHRGGDQVVELEGTAVISCP